MNDLERPAHTVLHRLTHPSKEYGRLKIYFRIPPCTILAASAESRAVSTSTRWNERSGCLFSLMPEFD